MKRSTGRDLHTSRRNVARWARRFPPMFGSSDAAVAFAPRPVTRPFGRTAKRCRHVLVSAIGALLIAAGLATVVAPAVAHADATGVLGIDPNRRYDANTYLGTHNSFATSTNNWTTPNQTTSVYNQLQKGVRVLNFDVYLGRQRVESGCVEVYQDQSLEVQGLCSLSLKNQPLQVFTAHRPYDTGYFLHLAHSYDELNDELNPVHQWLIENPREVVTMVFENHVHGDYQYLIDNELREAGFYVGAGCAAGAAICVFNPTADGFNPGLPVPGRPSEPWNVTRHGFPTLNQMADADYRFVLFRRDSDNTVRTHDPDVQDPNAPDTWADPRDQDKPIDDYKLPIFLVEHQPNGPGTVPIGGFPHFNYNGEAWVFHHWEDIDARWHRIPQIMWFDFFDRDGEHLFGTDGPSDPTGAMSIVQHLNFIRGSVRPISAAASVAGTNQFGWNRGDTKVTYSASGDTAFRYLRNAYGDGGFVLRDNCDGFADAGCVASDTIQQEGTTTISFAAVGNNGLGVRSNQAYIDVKIDRKPPNIDCTGNAGTYLADQPVAITCVATDPPGDPFFSSPSGVRTLSRSTITGTAGALGVGVIGLPVRATDYADNVRDVTVTFTVVVTFASLRNLTERYVTGQSLLNVLLNKLDAADKVGAAGNSVGRAQLIASYIDKLEKNSGGLIPADRAAILIRLAQAL